MSGNFWKPVLSFCLCAAVCTAQEVAESPYRLAYRFQAGEFLHYEMEDRAEVVTQNGGTKDKFGQPLESKSIQQTQLLKSYRVVTVDEDGEAVLEPIIEKVRMSSQSGNNPLISFDSTKDESPPKEFEKIAGTIGRALSRFTVSASGKLLKVKMLVDDVPKSFSDAAEKADPAINFLIVFPEKAINVGDKWSEKYNTSVSIATGLNRTVPLIRNYELVKVEDHVATIRYRTSLLAAIHDPEILTQLVQQTPRGAVEFDLNEGKIIHRSLEINNKVHEAFGPQTLLQARGESVERLVLIK